MEENENLTHKEDGDEGERIKDDVAALLREGHTIQITPQGNSMFPLFVDGRGDAAIIRPIESTDIKVGAVALYRRASGGLVMHRICKVNDKGVYFVGDNQTAVEGPLMRVQLLGVLTEFIHGGKKEKHYSVKNPLYIASTRLWLFVRPIRPLISRPIGVVYRFVKNMKRRDYGNRSK